MTDPARHRPTPRPRGKKRHAGWVPNQHGAWAMLVVPFLLGVFLRLRDGQPGWFLIPLFACWMVGYFAFHAASGWLKAPPKRKEGWVRPLATYAMVSATMGFTTLLVGGWPIALWAPAFVPLMLPALWLAAQRNERATIGGALTIAAAVLMIPIARYPNPGDAFGPGTWPTWLLTLLVFAYFFGTVLYVKTNIRERGSRPWLVASIAYHGVWAIIAAALAGNGLIPWWWTVFFLLATLRAWLVPPKKWSAKHIGFLEIGMSTLLIACFVLWPLA